MRKPSSKNLNTFAKEIFRKAIHICTAFIPLLLSKFYWTIEILLVLAALGFSLSEFLRLKGIEVPLVSFITRAASRKRDEGKFVLGPLMLVIGIVCSSLLFNEMCYTIGILSLAFGDGLASLAGKLFGKVKIPISCEKTCAGSLMCFIAIFCVSYAVSGVVKESLIIAFAGMVIEMLPLRDLDNLVIPVALAGLSKFLFI